MKNTLLIISTLLIFFSCKKDKKEPDTTPSPSTSTPTATFFSFAGEIGSNDNSSIISIDNNIVFCGNYNNKCCYFKASKSGTQIWRKEYNFGFQGKIYAVAETNTQDLFFCGSTTISGNEQILLVKTNSSGDTIWSKTYGTTQADYGSQIIKTSDNNLLLCGITYKSQDAFCDIYLIKVDQNGDTLWTKSYSEPDQEVPFALTQTQNGEFLVTGTNEDGGLPRQLYLLKISSTGTKLWDKKIGTADWYWGKSSVEISNGDIMVCGRHTISGYNQILLAKTDATGNLYWKKEFGNVNLNEEALSMKKNTDGSLIITGQADELSASNSNILLLKVDTAGNQIFFNRFGDSQGRYGNNLLKDLNDDNIITGSDFNLSTMYFTKTDKDGNYK